MLVYLFADQAEVFSWTWWGGLLIQILLAGVTSAATAFAILHRRNRELQRRSIDAAIEQYIQLGMQYPEMEDPTYCKSWSSDSLSDNRKVRYEFFCCFIFNLIETLHEFYGGDVAKITDHLYVDEMIELHHSWWSNNSENRLGYGKDFRNFVDARWKEVCLLYTSDAADE